MHLDISCKNIDRLIAKAEAASRRSLADPTPWNQERMEIAYAILQEHLAEELAEERDTLRESHREH